MRGIQGGSGFMQGVIRPLITGKYTYPDIVSSFPPQFHFYMELARINYSGRSAEFEDGILEVGIKEQERKTASYKITPSFRVSLPRKFTEAWFKRGG